MSDRPLTPDEVHALLRRLKLGAPKTMPKTTGYLPGRHCHERRVREQADQMRDTVRLERVSGEDQLKAIFGDHD